MSSHRTPLEVTHPWRRKRSALAVVCEIQNLKTVGAARATRDIKGELCALASANCAVKTHIVTRDRAGIRHRHAAHSHHEYVPDQTGASHTSFSPGLDSRSLMAFPRQRTLYTRHRAYCCRDSRIGA